MERGLRLLAHEEEPREWGPKAHVQSAGLPKKALYWASSVGDQSRAPLPKEETRRQEEPPRTGSCHREMPRLSEMCPFVHMTE